MIEEKSVILKVRKTERKNDRCILSWRSKYEDDSG